MTKKQHWLVYILKCSDGTLYTGITTDIKRRLDEHNDGSGSRYTRVRRPVTAVFTTEAENRSEASSLEIKIKKLSRKQKLLLIKNQSM